MIAGVTGDSGVLRKNDNERRVVEFCTERRLCVVNTYFQQKTLHNCIRVAKGYDRVEVKSMIDLVLVKKDILRYV